MEQRLIAPVRSPKLHAPGRAGNGDRWRPRQAERGGVAQDAGARPAVGGPGIESCERRRRQQDQLVLSEERIHTGAECLMAQA